MKTFIIVFFIISICFCLFAVAFVIGDAKRNARREKAQRGEQKSAKADTISGTTPSFSKRAEQSAAEKNCPPAQNMAATFFYTMPEKQGAQPMPVGYFVYGKPAETEAPKISDASQTNRQN